MTGEDRVQKQRQYRCKEGFNQSFQVAKIRVAISQDAFTICRRNLFNYRQGRKFFGCSSKLLFALDQLLYVLEERERCAISKVHYKITECLANRIQICLMGSIFAAIKG